jgi:sortase A
MSKGYEKQLCVNGSTLMGYIEIPKIDVKLPIYHGTSQATLLAGIGHMEGTSLPVGGADTHCVLTGHTGLDTKKMFTDLDQLEIGDLFFINVLSETLCYKVEEINVVLPNETDSLLIREGQALSYRGKDRIQKEP